MKKLLEYRNCVAAEIAYLEQQGLDYDEILEKLYSDFELSDSIKEELPKLVAYLMDDEP